MIWADRTWAPRGALCGENQEEKNGPRKTQISIWEWINWISPYMNFIFLDIGYKIVDMNMMPICQSKGDIDDTDVNV